MATHLLDRGLRSRSRREEHGLFAAIRHLDIVLLGATFAVSAFGLIMIYSATRADYPMEPTYYLKRQVVYVALGVVIMLVCMLFDYHRLDHWAYPLYGVVVLALVAVKVAGKSASVGAGTGASSTSEAQRWLPLGPIHLQPSEFGVLAVVVALACYAARHEHELGLRRVLVMLGIAAVPMLLIYKQPDLGTTIVLGVTLIGLLVFAGIRLRLLGLVLLAAAMVVIAGLTLHVLKSYQIDRLTCFLHQTPASAAGCNYQLFQARDAIGAGGLKGTGLFNGAMTNLQYVPDQYADTIFSAVGEQTGFIGCAALLGLFALMALRMVRAAQTARDLLGRVICGGALVFLVFSVFQNVGMNIGIMPITGIPLPFLSFGGSALLAFFAAVGLVLNVELRRFRMR